jgi:hypothetical protein
MPSLPPKEEMRPSMLRDVGVRPGMLDKSKTLYKAADGLRDEKLHLSRLAIHKNIPLAAFEKFIISS